MPGANHQHGHRARLRRRFLTDGGKSMPDYELLELILTQAQPRADTKPIAKDLLARFENLAAVLSAAPDELAVVPGIGEAAIVALKASREAGLRLARAAISDKPVLSAWAEVLDYCRAQLAHEKTERFHLLFLDRKNRLIADEVQQQGTVDHTPVYPREVVKRALELSATAIIMIHNHPSGDPSPSSDDIEITRAVMEAAQPLNITVHDHLVIGRNGESSLRSMGLMER
jgi:DNA repair protein RadC